MNKFIGILSFVLFLFVFSITAIIIGHHIYSPFSFYLVLYDIVLVVYLFVIPKLSKYKIWDAEKGFNRKYMIVFDLILILLGYYIIEFIYS